MIVFPPLTEPISYGLYSGSLLFSENQPNGTPNPSPLGSSLRNSQWTNRGSVFPGLGFSLCICAQKYYCSVCPPEPGREGSVHPRTFGNSLLEFPPWPRRQHGMERAAGCQHSRRPFVEGDRPYKERGLFQLPTLAAEVVGSSVTIFPQDVC